jgi:NAD(P)H-hydrate epimerase
VAERLWSLQPQVVLSAALPDNAGGGLNLEALSDDALERLDAAVLGPGLGPAAAEGREARTWERLQAFPGLLLLDADGLNRLAAHGPLAWLRGRGGPTWLTPHGAEFSRLFPQCAHQPPLEAARHAAEQASGAHPCSLLLKGARTVVAAADGRRWQLGQANPAAARTGLGDVLAGYAGGLAARGLAAGTGADAALLALAALSHASAGCRAVAQRGAGGGTAMAVAEMLCAITQ